jgi:hypothetical protein
MQHISKLTSHLTRDKFYRRCSRTFFATLLHRYKEVGSGPVSPEIYTDSKGSQLCCKLAVTITDSNRLRPKQFWLSKNISIAIPYRLSLVEVPGAEHGIRHGRRQRGCTLGGEGRGEQWLEIK